MSGIVPSRLKRLPRLILEDWIAIRVLTNDTVHSRSYYPEHPTKPKLIIFGGALTAFRRDVWHGYRWPGYLLMEISIHTGRCSRSA